MEEQVILLVNVMRCQEIFNSVIKDKTRRRNNWLEDIKFSARICYIGDIPLEYALWFHMARLPKISRDQIESVVRNSYSEDYTG